MNALQEVAISIQPNFKSGVSFTIYDCSFYTFNDEMGADQEAAVWESFQKQASELGENYLLMGRQITSGFKLRIQLSVNPSDLECYDSGFDKEIQEKIDEYQVNLEEWYALLTLSPQTNNFDIIFKVAEQAKFDINKTCCTIDAERNDCDSELGPYEIIDQQNLKYFVIGRLQCIFFGADGNCEDHCLNNTEDLYNLEATQFKVYPDSRYSGYDAIPEIGFCHIYFSEGTSDQINYNVNPILDIRIEKVKDKDDSDNDGDTNDYIYNEKQVDVYDLGMLTVVVDKGVKLYETLEKINTDCNTLLKDNNFLDEIDDFFLSEDALNTLLYSSYCNFDLLTDEKKATLLNAIVTGKTTNFLKFWKYFEAKYPLFVIQLYDSFESKLEFFKYQKKHIDFALKLLKYDLPNNLKAPFLAQYCEDYKEYYAVVRIDDLGKEYITVDDEVIDEIITIPYDVNKTLSFYSPNYNFKLDENTGNVKITTGGHYRVVSGGAPFLTYIVYQPENYFESIDPFDPVFLTGIDLPNFQCIPKLVPGIIFLAAQDFVDVENVVSSIMLAADIAATVSLVGNVGKLKYIGKLKLIFFSLEASGLTGSLLVQYTNLVEDPELKIKLSLFFAAMEITGSIGSPDFGTINALQNRASKLATEIANSTKIAGNGVESSADVKKGLTKVLALIGGSTGLLSRIAAKLGTGHPLYLHIDELDEIIDAVLISKYASLSDEAIVGFEEITDIATCRLLSQDLRLSAVGDELVTFFNESISGIKAWNGLFNTGIRTDIPWLTRSSKWIDEGGDFVEVNGKTILRKNGDDILEVKNEQILPTKYDYPVSGGSPVGETANGYQVVKNGGDLSVRRVPETSGYPQAEVDFLQKHPNAHVLERHGHDVTNEALIKRATGEGSPVGGKSYAPDGNLAAIPSHSSKFSSQEMVKQAIENVKPGSIAFSNKTSLPNNRWIVESPGNYGSGYPNGGGGLTPMNKVTAIYEEVSTGVFEIITMYPNKN